MLYTTAAALKPSAFTGITPGFSNFAGVFVIVVVTLSEGGVLEPTTCVRVSWVLLVGGLFSLDSSQPCTHRTDPDLELL